MSCLNHYDFSPCIKEPLAHILPAALSCLQLASEAPGPLTGPEKKGVGPGEPFHSLINLTLLIL